MVTGLVWKNNQPDLKLKREAALHSLENRKKKKKAFFLNNTYATMQVSIYNGKAATKSNTSPRSGD